MARGHKQEPVLEHPRLTKIEKEGMAYGFRIRAR